MDAPSPRDLRWYERTRLIHLPGGGAVPVRVKLWTPPWVVDGAARRLRAFESYHQLAETLASYNADSGEYRRARAQLDAHIAVDNVASAERNTRAIATATWALVGMTAALVVATVVLIVVTAVKH